MKGVHDLRFRPRELPKQMQFLFDQLRGIAIRRATMGFVWCLLITAALALLHAYAKQGLPPLMLLFGAVVFMGIGLVQWKGYRRKRDKVRFVCDLLEELHVDLHPLRKLRLALDLRPYDHAAKLIWSGTSSAGNPKAKYRDRWLHLDLLLADGTRMRLEREVGVKTKKGGIQSEKRRMFLAMKPNPKRYDVSQIRADADKLRKRMKDAVLGMFASHPDDFHVHVDPQEGWFEIKVSQVDQQISVDEVHSLLHALIGFLARRRR
jgi:hypothetical protein